MLAEICEGDDSTAARFLQPTVEHDGDAQRLTSPCVLVPDSDNDDSLGNPPTPLTGSAPPAAPAQPTSPPRTFSKRAAKCAAELLRQHEKSASVAQKDRCMHQLRRLGGAYRSLGQGQSPTVWLRYTDLNARVIRETEAYFDGCLDNWPATPHTGRRNGSLSATPKSTVPPTAGTPHKPQPLGMRKPLPSTIADGASKCVAEEEHHVTDDFTLSRGERFALSLLSMEDGADAEVARQFMPTYLLHKDARGDVHRVSIPSTFVSGHGAGLPSAWTDSMHSTVPLHHCWMYDETDDGLTSVQMSPPAAHSAEHPGAAVTPRKRSRTGEEATPAKRLRSTATITVATAARRISFDDDRRSTSARSSIDEDGISVQTLSGVSARFPTSKSLSATVIEHQNYRMQCSLLRQQLLFSPF